MVLEVLAAVEAVPALESSPVKPDDAMIERCAIALREHVANRAVGTKREGRPWMALPSRLQQDYRDEVIVVLKTAAAVRCG